MAAGTGPQRVGHLDCPGHTGRKADAVVCPGNVIVHGLGDGDDRHSLTVEESGIGKRVVAPDRNQAADAQVIQVGEHLVGEVVDFLRVGVPQVLGEVLPRHVAGTCSRSVEERSSGAADLVHDLVRELQHLLRGEALLLPVNLDQPGPSSSDAEHTVALAQGPHGHRTDGGVQPRYVTTACENADRPFRFPAHSHLRPPPS